MLILLVKLEEVRQQRLHHRVLRARKRRANQVPCHAGILVRLRCDKTAAAATHDMSAPIRRELARNAHWHSDLQGCTHALAWTEGSAASSAGMPSYTARRTSGCCNGRPGSKHTWNMPTAEQTRCSRAHHEAAHKEPSQPSADNVVLTCVRQRRRNDMTSCSSVAPPAPPPLIALSWLMVACGEGMGWDMSHPV